MDEENTNVFSSKITTGYKPLNNDLYSLTDVVPAIPKIINNSSINTSCDFKPRTDKYYVPKKRHQPKVKTIRDIRMEYEKEVYNYLKEGLDKQQSYLLRKIRYGSFRDENIRIITKKMLNRDTPILRSSWQMLMNVNPEEHAHTKQYVLWNGKRIQVNGSKGGISKFLCYHDLGNINTQQKPLLKRKITPYKKALLRDSLLVRFKPGPLSKKKYLDYSYQKYHVGDTKLVNLPKPGLDIQPAYGVPLEPSIVNFLNNLHYVDGIVTEKWAELAVTAVGTVKGNKAVQTNKGHLVTFDLKYKCDQNRILMRQDADKISEMKTEQDFKGCVEDDKCIIKTIVEDILNCVEINVQQDDMYTGEDEPREFFKGDLNYSSNTRVKNKLKKKYGELNRLAVTVIRLSDSEQTDGSQQCSNTRCLNSFCSLGCVCSSLQCLYKLRRHCGRVECMFKCICDFSKYKALDLYENDCSEFMPGLLKLDNEINLNLAKEEKRFHQTVIMTEDKRILLKPQRRNWKTSNKYAELDTNKSLITEMTTNRQLKIILFKLDSKNIEPWCMVHNLYKCFCKLKFTHSFYTPSETNDKSDAVSITDTSYERDNGANGGDTVTDNMIDSVADEVVNKEQELSENCKIKESKPTLLNEFYHSFDSSSCARVRLYKRSRNINYYHTTNNKIKEMEKDDNKLHKKLMSHICEDNIVEDCNNSRKESISVSESKVENYQSTTQCALSDKSNSKCVTRNVSNETYTTDREQLMKRKKEPIFWLASSYKQYKQRLLVRGEMYLEPPRLGRIALYTWNFILSRYRERKNHFLVLKKPPFRIFMAIDTNDEFFNNCIDIDNIRYDDLHNYPITIKYLLTNATDFKDSFCVLCGLSHCWELLGSVRKENTSQDGSDANNSSSELQENTSQDGSDANNSSSELQENTTTLQETELNLHNGTSEENEVCMELKQRLISEEKMQSDSDNNLESLECIKSDNITAPKQKMMLINDSKDESQINNNVEPPNKKKKRRVSENSNDELKDTHIEKPSAICPIISNDSIVSNDNEEELNLKKTNESAMSKWFVLTMDTGFMEMRFYKRGFFVKYERIIKCINGSRMVGTPIRMSTQICVDPNKFIHFGIYAIPSVRNCVIVGPYEMNESSGIKIVGPQIGRKIKKKLFIGEWIITDKVDNMKFIRNPLSVLREKNLDLYKALVGETKCSIQNKNKIITIVEDEATEDAIENRIIEDTTENLIIEDAAANRIIEDATENRFIEDTIENRIIEDATENRIIEDTIENRIIEDAIGNKTTEDATENKTAEDATENIEDVRLTIEDVTRKNVAKLVKPIKIRKTNQIYYIAPDGLLKKIPNNQIIEKRETTGKRETTEKRERQTSRNVLLFRKDPGRIGQGFKKLNTIFESTPAAFTVEPVVNLTESCNSYGRTNVISKPERGMFILKPEEINKRAVEQINVFNVSPSTSGCLKFQISDTKNVDVENYLATSTIVASSALKTDDEVYVISDDDTDESNWQEVWIECKNYDLGWISGRGIGNSLSFKFPGLNYSKFLDEKEALRKITQMFSTKVPVHEDVQLEWVVVKSKEELQTDHPLTAEDLQLIIELAKDGAQFESAVESTSTDTHNNDNEQPSLFTHLDHETSELEVEGIQLLKKAMSRSRELRDSIKRLNSKEHVSDRARSMFTKNLKNIMSNANYSMDWFKFKP